MRSFATDFHFTSGFLHIFTFAVYFPSQRKVLFVEKQLMLDIWTSLSRTVRTVWSCCQAVWLSLNSDRGYRPVHLATYGALFCDVIAWTVLMLLWFASLLGVWDYTYGTWLCIRYGLSPWKLPYWASETRSQMHRRRLISTAIVCRTHRGISHARL